MDMNTAFDLEGKMCRPKARAVVNGMPRVQSVMTKETGSAG
jgi:hypothetical protein